MKKPTSISIRNLFLGCSSVVAMLFVNQAMALPLIQFDLLQARWENVVGGSNVTYDPVSGFGDPAKVSWGTGGAQQSGYVFDARNTPFSENPETLFDLGTFTHNNFPIDAGTSITSADLRLRGNIDVTNSDNTTQQFSGVEFLFNFAHWETTNTPASGPCANGEANSQGDNINGCADRVTISGLAGNSTFSVGGKKLTLEIDGFERSGSPVSEFWTAERQENEAVLLAKFDTTTTVPLPGTLILMGVGALGLRFARKRATQGSKG